MTDLVPEARISTAIVRLSRRGVLLIEWNDRQAMPTPRWTASLTLYKPAADWRDHVSNTSAELGLALVGLDMMTTPPRRRLSALVKMKVHGPLEQPDPDDPDEVEHRDDPPWLWGDPPG